ncbi:DUF4097 family beta strand repeat-containing protein [Microbacterium sp. CPCC 204701]|uniref:DUF4097 family beta strand repeat-containing protein n=1 Tax=Microbacterium sp. CPCC 204701 TaxID=2493084 RepID=UPI000FDAC99A|nr:DUF4097 family beta strand repeat-containing protein [Microbacterium sp. CPCC 204701]
MSTTVTPPPPAPGTPAPPPAPASDGARAVAIVAIVLGAVVLGVTVVSAVVGTIASASVHTSTRTVAVAGVDDVDLDASAGVVRVEFGDVDEAELEVTSSWGSERWRFERDGDTLEIASPDRSGWLGWFGWGWSGWFGDRSGDAVLRLPSSLEGVDADMSLSAGDLVADGTFGELDVSLGAGSFDIAGAARSVSAEVSAGRGELDLEDVGEANLSVSAGSLDARLSGTQPDSVEVDVSAGSLKLTVPDGDYAVQSDVSAGGFDNGIGSDPRATRTIHVEVSAGEAVLRSER